MPSLFSIRSSLTRLLFLCVVFFIIAPYAHADFNSTATSWSNFGGSNGYTSDYTYKGQMIADHETSADPSNGGSSVPPDETDLASCSPDSPPGMCPTPAFGYYDGGTPYDPDDPSTLEDDYIFFRMRIRGDAAHKAGFKSYHWNVLLDVDADGYKEYWVDLEGSWTADNTAPDRLRILYNNENRQDIPDPDVAQVNYFSAYNSGSQSTSHTRLINVGDGSGDYWIEIQVPMTAFNDLSGNQVLFPNSPVAFVFSTGSSNQDPLQKDHMMDLKFLTNADPITFGDVIIPNGEPVIEFRDANLNSVEFYTVGDYTYVYVKDRLANTSSATVQTITVTVTDPATGDDEAVTLTESGPNTGIFTNNGGSTTPAITNPSPAPSPPTAWISGLTTSRTTASETWTLTYNSGTGRWTVSGSVSGSQTNQVTAGTPYISDNSQISFTLEQTNPSNGTRIQFTTYAADPLITSGTSGSDDDGNLQVSSGDSIQVSYTNQNSLTVTDQAAIVGPGEPFIQFTRANGLPSENFQLTSDPNTSDKLYVTVYHSASNTNPGTVQTITVSLSGLDGQTLTLTETGPNTGIFRNTTGLDTKISDGTVAPNDNLWEDIDGGIVNATFTYNGTPYSTSASLFYTAGAGRVYFTNSARTEDVEIYGADQSIFLKVVDSTYTCAGSLTVRLTSGVAGEYEDVVFAETSPGSGVYINQPPNIVTTETYQGSFTTSNGILSIRDGETVTASYYDCNDGDSNTTNNYKTDTATFNAPAIVINEVLFYPDPDTVQTEYVELYNASSQDVTVTGYRVTDGDNFTYTVPQFNGAPLVLKPGERIYISIYDTLPTDFYDSAGGRYFLFAPSPNGFPSDVLGDPTYAQNDRADQILLYNAANAVVDYVGWSSTTTPSLDFQGDDTPALVPDIWQDDSFKSTNSISIGYAIHRVSDGYDTNNPSDWVYVQSNVWQDIVITYVSIASFNAFIDHGRVTIEWRTSTEVNTSGFRLFREDKTTGAFEPVTDRTIPSVLNSRRGGTYLVADREALVGEPNTYLLVEVENNGNTREYGPFSVVPTQRPFSSPGFSGFGREPNPISEVKLRRLSTAKAAQNAVKLSQTKPPVAQINIPVTADGLYYLDSATIAAHLGLPLSSVKSFIKTGALALRNRGEPIAYLAGPGNKGLFFYGEGTDSVYSRENVYVLTREQGLTMGTIQSPQTGLTPATGLIFTKTRHYEENLSEAPALFSDPASDFWFWDYVVGGYADLDTKEFLFDADAVASTDLRASLALRLKSSIQLSGNHVIVSLNGVEIGEDRWTGTDTRTVILEFSQQLLREGSNTLQVTAVLDTGVDLSVFFIDSFDLTYHKLYKAKDNKLAFAADANEVVTASGFTGPTVIVLDITNPRQPRSVSGAILTGVNGGYEITFKPSSNARYLAATENAAMSVADLRAYPPGKLKNRNTRVDYLVVTSPKLRVAAQSLAEYRKTKGLETMVVAIDEIMNEFNFGIFHPEAIRDFLSYAYYNWRKAPQYVVLAGDGTYDYRDYSGLGGNIVPPMLFGTQDGLFPSDNIYADINDDHLPDYMIGRIPAVTPEELTAYVSKVAAYERTRPGDWASQVIMVADRPEPGADFSNDSEGVASLLSARYRTAKVYLQNRSFEDARLSLLNQINSGAALLNYMGHAGVDRLSQDGLLTIDDLTSLTNEGRFPVFAGMTCIIGMFDIPGYDSLAEEIVMRPGGGAIAALAATGYSIHSDAVDLDRLFAAEFTKSERVLGKMVRNAFTQYRREKNDASMLDIYNLIGDPALRVVVK